ncbi:hypothetical protein P8452_01605 [Trifolium repens]|nr:hypothetical protein P8452_01605 [Trifolium repens]
MAAESKKAADEMNKKKLHGDSSTAEHNNSNMVPSKGGGSSPPSDARSCVSSLRDVSGSFKEGDVDHEYQFTDQNVPYAAAAGSYYGDVASTFLTPCFFHVQSEIVTHGFEERGIFMKECSKGFSKSKGGAYQEASRVWHAKDISIPQRTCAWISNGGFMSVNTTLGVGRVFRRSICEQYAAWGIDLGTATSNLLSLHLS